MPRRRKGVDYLPFVPVFERDAMTTDAEIEGEPDPRKRRELKRARDEAVVRLMKLSWDTRVRVFLDLLRDRYGDRLPKAKGGRPVTEHRRLLIAVNLHETIERRGGKHGDTEAAIREIAEPDELFDKRKRRRPSGRKGQQVLLGPQRSEPATRFDYIKEILKDTNPEWLRAVAVELKLRQEKFHFGSGQ
jgi:hypothetical protein